MAKAIEAPVKTFGTVSRETLPKRGRIARERTAEELAMRDSILSVIADGVQGAVDPESYPSKVEARKAAGRYRSLMAPVLFAGSVLQTRVDANVENGFTLTLLLGKARQRK